MTVYAANFVSMLLSQRGDHYRWAGEIVPGTKNPDYYDCSEFTQWGAHMVGGYLPDGSGAQFDYCSQRGTLCAVAQATATVGALLWHQGHIAVSLGNGHTIEARSAGFGVGIFEVAGRGFTHGMRVPGMLYGPLPKPPASTAPTWPGRFITQPAVMTMLADELVFQRRLHALGLYGGPIDGLYGPSSESAARVLQRHHDLVVDGIVGPKTWYAAWRTS